MEAKKLMMLQNVAFLILLTFSSILFLNSSANDELQTYIVHLSTPSEGQVDGAQLKSWYDSFLPISNPSNVHDEPRMVYAYHNVLRGFAAKLTADEVKAMEKKEGFVRARPGRVLSLQTTHSPSFLGLHQNLGAWQGSNYGKGLIIGLLDTGITPFHPSFNDKGMPPPPAKWKGICEFTDVDACNKKLVGARNFIAGSTGPPIDEEGHGTHTASTAAGNFVSGANVFGNANGTAEGIAPLAHVAMYKVCGENDCLETDMLAALDAAIEDGVDVISISIGGPSAPFYDDNLAIGSFAAMQKGIFVSLAAGNSGPFNATLSNEAPWMLTVGASTIDRKIKATATLGNKEFFEGETLFQPKDFADTFLPLVFPGTSGDQNAAWCAEGSLHASDVKGKVVLCERGGGIARIAKGQAVKDAGGAAMILMNDGPNGASTLADAHVLPAIHVGFKSGEAIKIYLNSTTSPVASITFQGTVIGDKKAPQVTSFSSRGPNLASPGILKPDIIGPGVSILAAWNESVENKTDKANFNIISGTSMACPHLAGIATLLKSAHPDWSPAAVKSAIMTTANLLNLNQQPITDERELQADIFAIGAGHVNPSKAINPGLVYDIQPNDYIPYLCGLGYTNSEIAIIVGKFVPCTKKLTIPEAELNYPSFAVTLGSTSQSYTRTVTNVGEANSSYVVKISAPLGVTISVSPSRLDFSALNQKLSYKVMFLRGPMDPKVPFMEGDLTWASDKFLVRSPISFKLI